MGNLFERFTTGCARFAGRPAMLAVCMLLGLVGVTAFLSGHDLIINGANLAISVVTLLLLPILQATQNRDGAALQAKVDELIKANAKARDDLIGLESRGEEEIEHIRVDEGQREGDGESSQAAQELTRLRLRNLKRARHRDRATPRSLSAMQATHPFVVGCETRARLTLRY